MIISGFFVAKGGSVHLGLPRFNPDGGSYPNGAFPLDVTISVQGAATKFRYTINDANIDENTGTLVNATSGVVSVTNHDVLRAIALDANGNHSNIKTAEYDHDHEGVPGGGGPPIIP